MRNGHQIAKDAMPSAILAVVFAILLGGAIGEHQPIIWVAVAGAGLAGNILTLVIIFWLSGDELAAWQARRDPDREG